MPDTTHVVKLGDALDHGLGDALADEGADGTLELAVTDFPLLAGAMLAQEEPVSGDPAGQVAELRDGDPFSLLDGKIKLDAGAEG